MAGTEPTIGVETRRPWAFLVSLGGRDPAARGALARDDAPPIDRLQALAPALERLGTWRVLDRPEANLPHLAAKARADGYRPIHLALGPVEDVYLTPAVPTVLFPTWAYPDVPRRDFAADPRPNWGRIARYAAAILAPNDFNARAFERSGLACPVGIVPIPIDPAAFDLPDWGPTGSRTFDCRHAMIGGVIDPAGRAVPASPSVEGRYRRSWRRATLRAGRGVYLRVSPYLKHPTRSRIERHGAALLRACGRSPESWDHSAGAKPSAARLASAVARFGFNKVVRRWLSAEAVGRIGSLKRRFTRSNSEPTGPEPAASSLTLGGLVFACRLDPIDPRSNLDDLLSAFVAAFRDRADATLVVELASPPDMAFHHAHHIRHKLAALGPEPACRVVVIAGGCPLDFLSAATFVVTACHAEATAAFIRRGMAAGRPAIAPTHSGLDGLVDESNGFVVGSSPEPTSFPGDLERRAETTWGRLSWSDLRDRFVEAAEVAGHPNRYARLATAARERMIPLADPDRTVAALACELGRIGEDKPAAVGWATD